MWVRLQKELRELAVPWAQAVASGLLAVAQGGIENVETVNMTALELELDPVLITDIIEHEGRKIGYLFYTQYIGPTKIDLARVTE